MLGEQKLACAQGSMCSMEAQISQQEGTLYVDSGRVQSSRPPDATVRQHARLRDAGYRYRYCSACNYMLL